MMTKNLFSRGQAEVVGLVVIVLLLLFIGVIFLRFYLMDSGTSLASTRQQLDAQYLLHGITRLSYHELSFRDRVADCHRDPSSCPAFEMQLEDVFRTVLRPGKNYQLFISTEEQTVLTIGNCGQGIVSTSTIGVGDVFYDLRLLLC